MLRESTSTATTSPRRTHRTVEFSGGFSTGEPWFIPDIRSRSRSFCPFPSETSSGRSSEASTLPEIGTETVLTLRRPVVLCAESRWIMRGRFWGYRRWRSSELSSGKFRRPPFLTLTIFRSALKSVTMNITALRLPRSWMSLETSSFWETWYFYDLTRYWIITSGNPVEKRCSLFLFPHFIIKISF